MKYFSLLKSRSITGPGLTVVAALGLGLSSCEDKVIEEDSDAAPAPQVKGSSPQASAPAPQVKGSSSQKAPAPAPAATPAAPDTPASSTVSTSDAPAATLTSKDTAVLKKKLTDIQYEVAVLNGTERSFQNEYWDNKEPGIYVDIISGKPLFASTHKFKSGTGWPSFYQPLEEEEIVQVTDTKYGMVRSEVRSKTGDTHLGHVFDDGPEPTGLRYCINSASLRFVPKEKLAEEGLEEYLKLFDEGS